MMSVGTRVTEIELPDFTRNWKEFLDDHLLEVGHTSSPWVTRDSSHNVTAHVPTLAEPIT